MFAFIMPNRLEPLTGQPRDYLVSLDRAEKAEDSTIME